MQKIKDIFAVLLFSLLLGCTSKVQPEIVYRTEYQKVNVPVIQKLNRPNRPIYTDKDTLPGYLSKVLHYTKSLEVIIDSTKE